MLHSLDIPQDVLKGLPNFCDFELQSDRLRMTPVNTDDLSTTYLGYFQANTLDLLDGRIITREDMEQDILRQLDGLYAGTTLSCFIYTQKSWDFVGWISLMNLPDTNPEIGIWVVPRFQRNGYGKEAYRAMLDWVKENLPDVQTIQHATKITNMESANLAEHFGGSVDELFMWSTTGYKVYSVPVFKNI